MRLFCILLTTILSVTALAKSNGGKGEVVPNTSPSFYQQKVQPVLEALQAGDVTVMDPNCINPSYSQVSDLLTATISGQNFYMVLNPTTVNGLNYNASYCQQATLSNGAFEVECSATEQNAKNPPGSTLTFTMEYAQTASNPNFYTIYKCPQASQ